jgi:hypothetical protein
MGLGWGDGFLIDQDLPKWSVRLECLLGVQGRLELVVRNQAVLDQNFAKSHGTGGVRFR